MKMKNDKIRELAAEAGLIVEEWDGFNSRSLTPAQEKFAELIVGECIEVIDSTSDNIKLMRVDPYQKIIWAIEQHFGVEE